MKKLFLTIVIAVCCIGGYAQTLSAPIILANNTTNNCDVHISLRAQVITGPSSILPVLGSACGMSIPISIPNASPALVYTTVAPLTAAGYTFALGDVIEFQIAEFQLSNCNPGCMPINGSIGSATFCGGIAPSTWTNVCNTAQYVAPPFFGQYIWY